MKAVLFMYDIPTTIKPEDYPGPCSMLRPFAARIEYSCWVVPEGQMPRTIPVTEALLAVGATVDTVRFDETDAPKILQLARKSIERDAQRIRAYVEKSVATTAEKLAEARALQSVDKTNAAIRYQQTVLNKAGTDLNDAESCALAFDLTGDLAELVAATRGVIEARAASFRVEAKAVRKEAKAAASTDTVLSVSAEEAAAEEEGT